MPLMQNMQVQILQHYSGSMSTDILYGLDDYFLKLSVNRFCLSYIYNVNCILTHLNQMAQIGCVIVRYPVTTSPWFLCAVTAACVKHAWKHTADEACCVCQRHWIDNWPKIVYLVTWLLNKEMRMNPIMMVEWRELKLSQCLRISKMSLSFFLFLFACMVYKNHWHACRLLVCSGNNQCYPTS